MPRRRSKINSDAPYRIKELAEISGISREAIRFYINEGLLPPPLKSAHNMGWYSDRHVELLRVIQKLQTERFLPLKAIRLLLSGDQPLDFTEGQARAFEDMRRKIAVEHRDLIVSDDPGKLAVEMGLSRWEQKELKAFGLAANNRVSMSDVEIARQWIAVRDAGLSLERGFSPANMAFMQDVVDIALRSELEIFRKRIEKLGAKEAAKIIDIVIPALNRLFALLHDRRVATFVEELARSRKAESTRPRRAKPASDKPLRAGSAKDAVKRQHKKKV